MGSQLLACARPATPGKVGYESESAGGSRTMEHEVVGGLPSAASFVAASASSLPMMPVWLGVHPIGLLNPRVVGWMWLCRCRGGRRLGMSSPGMR